MRQKRFFGKKFWAVLLLLVGLLGFALLLPLLSASSYRASAAPPVSWEELELPGTGGLGLDYSLSEINAGYMFSKAIVDAYPGIAQGPHWQEGDWAVELRGKTFYWAGGRLLDAQAKAEPDYKTRYSAYRFQDYPEELPEQPGRWGGQANYSSYPSDQTQNPVQDPWQGVGRPSGRSQDRNMEFFYTLYNTWERSDMVDVNAKEIVFLGKRVKVHQMLEAAMGRVDETLREQREQDAELAAFLDSLQSVGGFYWRNIAGSDRLSLHSYGIAVDLLPRRWIGDPYWYWIKDQVDDWGSHPYEKRWQVPDIVVKTFEREGFTWGGKWYMFDNMHFEYHPEIRLLKPYFASLQD